MAPRGLSMDEKKRKMLEIFHETAEFYSLKELEKIAPIVQSVKEVVDDLVRDGLVQMDKMYLTLCRDFWSLPSAAGATKQAVLLKAQKELDNLNSKIKDARQGLKEAEKGREDTDERRGLLEKLNSLSQTSTLLKTELAAFGAADPVKYERKERAVGVCKDAAMRWTDNTMILLQFACGLGAEESQLRQCLGLSAEWEDFKM
ncbi:hypothetical protein IAU60_000687 [Kwoniella sp. DSM 27419]